ncbi:MAG TPA: hypothetical protein VM869_04930 [Enhygromyxa sp.]|nr:hypothetical protein [Enhygromyxa sp.]
MAIAVLGMLAMLAIAAILGPARLVAGDGHYVFAAARSLAYDGDLDLTNQYWVMGDRWGLGRDPTIDRWRLPPREIGPSLLMVPGLWLHMSVGASAVWEPAFACLGAAASLGLCWLGCVRTIEAGALGISSVRAELLAGAAVFGFVVPYYAVGSSGYPHALDAAIGAWLVWALVARKHAVVVGGLLACAVLTRMQNALWLLWPIAELVLARVSLVELRRVGVIAVVGALGFVPQLWLGLEHPGSERGAIGWTLAFFNFEDYPRDLVRVLFGAHGLVRWTPIAALGLIGLGLDSRRGRTLAVVGGLWLLLASVRDVDGGDAFGARRMAGIVGLLALGLARVDGEIRARRVVMIGLGVLVAINVALTGLAIAGRVSLASPEPVRGPR